MEISSFSTIRVDVRTVYIKNVKIIVKNVYFDQWMDLKLLPHFIAIT